MSTLRLKKTSTRQTKRVASRPGYKPRQSSPTLPRFLGGADAQERLQAMQQDMDRIAKGEK